jgi:nicotinamidase-related amidase
MNPALIVIDVQEAFDDPRMGNRNNPGCEDNIRSLLNHWREKKWPVILVRHDSISPGSPLAPGNPGNSLKPGIDGPHDLFITKQTNSAFYGEPSLDGWLKETGIKDVVICGITTDHCCSTTARMADNLGYGVTVVEDAMHTHDRTGPGGEMFPADEVHRVNIASLNEEFARVVNTKELTHN